MGRIKFFKTTVGEEMAILINNNGSPFPYYWSNNFITSEYRNTGKSINTIARVLRTINMAYDWANSYNLNFDDLLSVGDFLSIQQVENLAFFLRLDSKSQSSIIDNNLKSIRNSTKKIKLEELQGYRKTIRSKLCSVTSEEGATRIRWMTKYMQWHLDIRIGVGNQYKNNILNIGNSSITRLNALVPKVSSGNDDESLEGLTPEICKLANEIFTPKNSLNPFTAGFHQERNYLIWRLLFETGMRRAELSFVKVEDILSQVRIVNIKKSKTKPRAVPISESTASKFHEFLMKYWSKLPKNKRKLLFLFTTERGEHLKLASINLIFRTVKNIIVGDFKQKFSPHALRRTFVERFLTNSEELQDGNSNDLEKYAILNRLLGWAANSEMPQKYGKGYIKKRADAISQKIVDSLINSELDSYSEK